MTATHDQSDPRTAAYARDIADIFAENWWAIALRGAFGILFGIIAFLMPGVTVLTLILLFAAYMLADGVLAMVAGVRAVRRGERSWPMFLEGVADLIAGGIAIALPSVTVFVLVYLFGFWAIISGGFLIAAGLRRTAPRSWLLGVDGGISVLWGALIIFWLFTQPQISVLAVIWWIGIYALVFGTMLLIAALTLRRRRTDAAHHSVPHTA